MASSNTTKASVSAGMAVVFADDVTGQSKDDVLNSTLFGQLAATKQFDRQQELERWTSRYAEVLETIGWVVQNTTFSDVKDVNSAGSVDKLVLKLIRDTASPQQLDAIQKMINALKASENDKALKIFNSQSGNNNSANFQIGYVSNDNDGATLHIFTFAYKANASVSSPLFFEFGNASVDFKSGNQVTVLNAQVYAQVREAVLQKLGDYRKDQISDISL